jgi:predicted transposase YbfD/YdcC
LPGGIPSHGTFNRVISALDPAEMERGFADWVVSIARLTAGEVVAIDGKALCGTREAGKKTLVHMVSAWASANNLVLAERKVDDKSNEITAIPRLLNALELSGTVVTIDAMSCQRSIAEKIVHKKADYVLAVKENQGHLLAEIKDSFQMLKADAVAEQRGNDQHGVRRIDHQSGCQPPVREEAADGLDLARRPSPATDPDEGPERRTGGRVPAMVPAVQSESRVTPDFLMHSISSATATTANLTHIQNPKRAFPDSPSLRLEKTE